MPTWDEIDVRVLVAGKELQEYADTENASEDDEVERRYIEAEEGAQFEIQVKLLEDYDFKGAEFVSGKICIDDNPNAWVMDYTKEELGHREDILWRDFTHVASRLLVFNARTTSWEGCPLIFGKLEMEDTAKTKLTVTQLRTLGSIRVSLFRAAKRKLPKPLSSKTTEGSVGDSIGEEKFKGKSLTRKVNFGPGEAFEPNPREFKAVPIKGENGQVYKFIFLYRDHACLQSLGLIPRTPSPAPDPDRIRAQNEEMIKEAKRKEREKNREIERLKRQLAEIQAGPRDSSAASGIDGYEILDIFEPAPKRPKAVAPEDVVDLTDD